MPEEEVVTKCDDDIHDDWNEQIALCLRGKLHTNDYFNAVAMKSVLKNVWKPSKRVIIRDLYRNLFEFQFFSTADKADVLNEGPWTFEETSFYYEKSWGSNNPQKCNLPSLCFG